MKTLTYNQIYNKPDFQLFSENDEEELKKKLADKYGEKIVEEDWLKILTQLTVLLNCIGSLKGKTVLDLGCGCNYSSFDSDRNRAGETYSAWLCRALHELGERSIGVDKGNLEGELFEHYGGVNLTLPGSLDFIQDYSIDIANARLFFSSPELNSLKCPTGIKQILLPQLERIVKPDGYLVLSEE